MPIYAITNDDDLVLRIETADVVPDVGPGEEPHEITADFDFSTQPTIYHLPYWDGADAVEWRDERDLTAAKNLRWEQEKAERTEAEMAVLMWSGRPFDCDEASWLRILEASVQALGATFAGTGYSRTWICADNTTREMDKNDILALALAMANRREALFDASVTVRAAIDAAMTVAEVDAI